MESENKYLKVIQTLKNSRPVLTTKEKLTDDIMKMISESSEKITLREMLINALFGWVNIYWVRGTMTIAAILFSGLFIIQQLIISHRINSLEKQLVETINTIDRYKPLGINQKVLLNMYVKDQMVNDSLTVSTSDLKDLLNHYSEFQENNGIDIPQFGLNPQMQRRIRQSLEENTIAVEL